MESLEAHKIKGKEVLFVSPVFAGHEISGICRRPPPGAAPGGSNLYSMTDDAMYLR